MPVRPRPVPTLVVHQLEQVLRHADLSRANAWTLGDAGDVLVHLMYSLLVESSTLAELRRLGKTWFNSVSTHLLLKEIDSFHGTDLKYGPLGIAFGPSTKTI